MTSLIISLGSVAESKSLQIIKRPIAEPKMTLASKTRLASVSSEKKLNSKVKLGSVLYFDEIQKLSSEERKKYFRSLSKLLIALSPNKKTFGYQMLIDIVFPTSFAEGEAFRCIGGGAPVPAQEMCGLQSYAGYTCPRGERICNPFIFGVKSNDEPICYPDATTENCYKRIRVGTDSSLDLVFEKAGNQEGYNKFVNDVNNICHHVENNDSSPLVEVRENPRTLRLACQYIRRQTEINRERNLKGYTSDQVFTPCENGGCEREAVFRDSNTEDCQMVLEGRVINCNSTSKTQRSWESVKKLVCAHNVGRVGFCPSSPEDDSANSIDGYLRRIEVAAEVLGLDRRQLACMTLIESRYRTGLCSSAGACGLTQFMPQAGTTVSRSIKSNYVEEWNSYQQQLGGEPFDVSTVTSSNIRTGHVSYGIFAMGVYLRDSLNRYGSDRPRLEDDWNTYLAQGGDALNLFHAQIGAYNWRPGRIDDMTDHALSGNSVLSYSPLVSETENYMTQFNQCMYSDSGWYYAGANPSSSDIRECNLETDEPVCEHSQTSQTTVEAPALPVFQDEATGAL